MGKHFTVAIAAWLVGAYANSRVQQWQNKRMERAAEEAYETMRQEWKESLRKRLEILSEDRECETAEWLNAILSKLWDDVVAPATEKMVPEFIQMELDQVLDAEHDEHASVPSFLRDLMVEEYSVSRGRGVAPLRINGIRVIEECGIRYGRDSLRRSTKKSRKLMVRNPINFIKKGISDTRFPSASRSASAKTEKESKSSRNGEFAVDVDFEVITPEMNMKIVAKIDNILDGLINGLIRREVAGTEVRITTTEARMTGVMRILMCPKQRLMMIAFQKAPEVMLAMTLHLHEKLNNFYKEIPVTTFPAIPTLLNRVIQLAIEEYVVWPRYYLINLAPPQALGAIPVPAPATGYIDVKLIEATGLQPIGVYSEGKDMCDASTLKPRVTYMWGTPSRTKKGKTGVHSRKYYAFSTETSSDEMVRDKSNRGINHFSWSNHGKGKGPDGFYGQILGGAVGDLVTLKLYCKKHGKVGECHFKVMWAPEGATLFYWADDDGFPVVRLGGPATPITLERGLNATGKIGYVDAWIPIEKTNGRAKVHVQVQVEWTYDPEFVQDVLKNEKLQTGFARGLKATAGIAALMKEGSEDGITQQEKIDMEAAFHEIRTGANARPMQYIAVIEGRDLGLNGRWACQVFQAGKKLLQTEHRDAPNPEWRKECEMPFSEIGHGPLIFKVSRPRSHKGVGPLGRLHLGKQQENEDYYEGRLSISNVDPHEQRSFWVALSQAKDKADGIAEPSKRSDVPAILVRVGIYFEDQEIAS